MSITGAITKLCTPNLNLKIPFLNFRHPRNAAKSLFFIYSELVQFNLNYEMYFYEIHVTVAISAEI